LDEPGSLDRMRRKLRDAQSGQSPENPELRILCRTTEQLRAAAELGVNQLYAEFQDIREYGEAVATAHANGSTIYLATPRIQKPDEMGIFHSLGKHEANGILVRNFAGLQFFKNQEIPIVADFSMNVANELTAEFLITEGAERVTASYDLNRDQLFDLVAAVPTRWLEVVIHQHMPMFHMEHCVFCAVLSPGTNKTNCGRPCDTLKVELRDRIGMEHPLTADVGCRNTLYNAVPQSSAEIVSSLQAKGIRDYRVELLRETPIEVAETIRMYRNLLDGTINGAHVWKELKANNRVGVTRGTLEDRNPLAII
jgi:putative protease